MCHVLVPDLRSSFSNVLIPRPYGLGYTTAGPSALGFADLILRANFNLSNRFQILSGRKGYRLEGPVPLKFCDCDFIGRGLEETLHL